MPTPSKLASRLTTYCMNALASGQVFNAKAHTSISLGSGKSLVTWQSEDNPDFAGLSIESIESYLFFLENERFSVIMNDGSIIQMSFKIKRGDICGHRLAYIPCPVIFDPLNLEMNSLYDVVVERLFSGVPEHIAQRGVVRFDFDPDAAGDQHPPSHLTLNYDETRIAVSKSMDAKMFLAFIDDNFLSPRQSVGRLGQPFSSDGSIDVSNLEACRKPHLHWTV